MTTTNKLAITQTFTSEFSQLLTQLDNGQASFQSVLDFIATHFDYTPVPFVNGELHNAAGENEGSCKVFGLAKRLGLDKVTTLKLFAEHFAAVKQEPNGTNHANIRNFSFFGWQGFAMPKNCLSPK